MKQNYIRNLCVTLAIAMLGGSGCPSVTTMTTAKTIGKGNNDFTFSPSAYGVAGSAVGSTSSTDIFYGGAVDIMYRRGFTDNFDLGASLTGLGLLSIDGKINFIDTKNIALALDPGIGGVFTGISNVGAGYLQVTFPVLFDVAFSDSVRLTLGPRYMGIYSFATAEGRTASAYSHWVGGSLGIEFKLGKVFRLMPHGGAVAWVNKPEGVTGFLFTGGLACKFIF
jgi:hypothetical protein